MKTFDQICNQVHDASGITSLPNNYMWSMTNGVWYPVDQILNLIDIEVDKKERTFEVVLGDYQFSGTFIERGTERSYRWEVEIDWFLDEGSEKFYDENHELIDQLVYEKF